MSPDPSSMTLFERRSNPYNAEFNKYNEQLHLYIESGSNFDVSPASKSKIIVLGNSGVGKTSIIYSHKYGNFGVITPSATIGASYINCNVVVKDDPIQLQIWDTAGQERFRCMVPMYMRNATAAIIVYDVTNRKSFEEVDKWYKELLRCSGIDDPLIFLIGNKIDLENLRQVTKGEGLTKAGKLKAKFFEVSASECNIIDNIFATLAENVYEKIIKSTPPLTPNNDDENNNSTTKTSSSPILKLPIISPKNSNESKKNKKSCCIIS